jgi:hypothetical protein
VENFSEFGFTHEGKVYLKGYATFNDRVIGEVKESEEASIAYFVKRFALAEAKVDELIKSIHQAENKGSYLQKLIHLRTYLHSFEGLGDFTKLLEKLDREEVSLLELISKNRVKNTTLKEALLLELDAYLDSHDWINASEKVKEIKLKWLKIGNASKEEEDRLELLLKEKLDYFYNRRNDFFEERNRVNLEKIRKYEAIILKAEQLKDAEDILGASNIFKELHDQWKAIGSVPKQELSRLWTSFKAYNDYFIQRYKAFKRQKKSGGGNANDFKVRKFEQLLHAANQLIEDFPVDAPLKAKELLDEWRKLGKLIDPRMRDINVRFRFSTDKIFELDYLNRTIDRRAPGFDLKTPKEQLRIRVTLMKELISKDRTEIMHFEDSFVTSPGNREAEGDKLFLSKMDMKKRRLKVKEAILFEMEENLKQLL